MLVVVAFFQGDAWLAKKNIEHWIWLDEAVPNPCLLVYDKETSKEVIDGIRELAKKYFGSVMEHNCGLPPSRQWPMASNYVFHQTVWHLFNQIQKRKMPPGPWLWVESDSVALKKGWIRQIEQCHKAGGKPFTGHWNADTRVWNGVSVYPDAVTIQRLTHEMMMCVNNPWDVVASRSDGIERHLNKANHLFQHSWADPATGAPYTFGRIEEAQALIRDTVVLFHRCKDGSLIDVLQGKAKPHPEDRIKAYKKKAEVTCEKVTVVERQEIKEGVVNEAIVLPKKQNAAKDFVVAIPICDKDAKLAMLNLELAIKLDGSCGYDAILSYDTDTKIDDVRSVRRIAEQYFVHVDTFVYPPPAAFEWPKPQNHAWKRLAAYIEKHFKGTWFWWEQDAVPLKKGWLDRLVDEFVKSQKFFMGYIVEEMGHMNGVAFYPCNLSKFTKYDRFKKAFDVEIRAATIHLTHRANHLFQNIWGFNKDGVHSFGVSKAPSFMDQLSVDKMIDFNKVIFHRCKDGTLAQRLLERK